MAEGQSQHRLRPCFSVTFFNDAERPGWEARRAQLVRKARPPVEPWASRHAAARQVEIARFVQLADELTPPSFAAFLHVAVYEGMRPGELDALPLGPD